MSKLDEKPSETPTVDKLLPNLIMDGHDLLIEEIKQELRDKIRNFSLTKEGLEEALNRIPETGAREELQKIVLHHLATLCTDDLIRITGHNPWLNERK